MQGCSLYDFKDVYVIAQLIETEIWILRYREYLKGI